MKILIFIALILYCCKTIICADYSNFGSVYYSSATGFFFVPNILDKINSLAYGVYNDTVDVNGWGILDIKAGYGNTNDLRISDYEKNQLIMQAAGFLEGSLTADRIEQHATNMYDFFFVNGIKDNQTKANILAFLNDQESWMRSQMKSVLDPIWRHVSYLVAQYDGLIQGYNNVSSERSDLRKIPKVEFDIINDSGDLLDLQNAVNRNERKDFLNMKKHELDKHILKMTHCSALVKATAGYENVFMSHSSWFTYQAMLRIYKHYDFNINDVYTMSKGVSFSSYPGQINSLDDFYIMSNNLVMIQTTNAVFNTNLYDLVTPKSLLAWHRVRIANMMAADGNEWSQILAQYNSGTYNNQYMVIDLNKIVLNQGILDNALWVAEQIPGMVVADDQTNILRTGYWPSYNVPFYENIYILSGYPDIVKKFGPEYSYQLAPRAKIFRRDQAKVVDMDSMKKMMRYNNYKNETYSDNDSCKTICCRGDITGSWSTGGCYDTKVTDYFLSQTRQAFILNGPTTDGNLPPFSWDQFPKVLHNGMPDVFNFSFVFTQPSL